ncbi:MAG: cytochrome c oxidase subunit II [Gemmatimonadota bacterium]
MINRRTGWARALTLVAAVSLAGLVLAACGGEYTQSALEPRSDFARSLDDLFRLIFWWAAAVFVVVEGALLFTIIRFRDRPGAEKPKPVHGNTALEIAWTLAPAIVLMLIAIPTIKTIWIVDQPPPGDPLVVEAIGHQWWWEFRYPEQGIVTANELHLPVDRTVDIRLTSADVIHSFWIPRLGGKRDAMPGHETFVWFKPDSVGTYTGQCAEFCGMAHALMKMELVVEEQADFDSWAESMSTPVVLPAPADSADEAARLLAAGSLAFQQGGCIACHRIAGTPAQGVLGPDLTHIGSRRTIAAGILENTPQEMARWIRDPQAIKPGVLMPSMGLSEEQIQTIVAYLQGLE